jgi:hypothetical protein
MTFQVKKVEFKGDDMISKLYERTSELKNVINDRGRREVIITRA